MRALVLWLVAASLCLIPTLGIASTQVEAMLQQAETMRSANPENFEQLLLQLRQRATLKQQEQLDFLNAYAQGYAGHYEVAIKDARRLLESSSDVDLQFRAGMLMVNCHALLRQFTEGLRQLDQTLPLIDKVKNLEWRLNGLGVASFLYNQIGQYKLGLHFADQILSQPAPERTQCFAGHGRLEALQNLTALPTDDVSITRVIDKCTGQVEMAMANFVRGILARKWAVQGKRDEAIDLLQEHLAEVEATRYPRLIGEIQSLLAELLLAKGDIAGAEDHARAAIAHSASLANSPPLVVAYKTMYEIAQRRHDLVAALSHYRSYAEADKAYLNDVKARELAYQIVRHETQQKTQEIELLNRQNQVLQLQQRVGKQSAQNTKLLVILLLLSLALIGYWAYGIKRRQMSLRRLAETDALTGVSNRRHFTQQSERALTTCAQTGEPAALVMFDLDHFKAINDSYGHVTGDWVLTRVAEACKTFCRRVDHFGRLGGEEFAILLHGVELGVATRLAEDCRVRIASIDTRESSHAFAITASFGVSVTSLSGYDLARLLAHADKSLYRAKREGRNRVYAFTGEEPVASRAQVVAIDGRSITP